MAEDFWITLAAVVGFVGFCIYASWRANLPPNPKKPRLLPWNALIIFSAFLAFLAIVHFVNLLGVDTSRRY